MTDLVTPTPGEIAYMFNGATVGIVTAILIIIVFVVVDRSK